MLPPVQEKLKQLSEANLSKAKQNASPIVLAKDEGSSVDTSLSASRDESLGTSWDGHKKKHGSSPSSESVVHHTTTAYVEVQ